MREKVRNGSLYKTRARAVIDSMNGEVPFYSIYLEVKDDVRTIEVLCSGCIKASWLVSDLYTP